ncbi:MAG TPA: TonB-dependent receptor [Steroidobacteraceae bacterium]
MRSWLLLGTISTAVLTSARASETSDEESRYSLDEVVVTGSRLRLKDPEGPSPVTSFSRTDIDALGATTVTEVLKYLPQQPYVRSENFRPDGAQFVELRGLGTDMTLVLINGRRIMPSASGIAVNGFDLNTIPLAAVERVEVLSDAASAVYGADAVGGVVNIILKQEIPAPVLDLHYGAADGGGEEQRASLSAGLSGERARGSVVLDYLHRDFLLGEARDRWRNQDYTRFGGTDQRSLNANPGNISSRTTANLPGLSSPVAAVPDGSSGIGLTPEDLHAGVRNLDSLARYSSIVPQGERVSAATFGEWDLGARLTAFAELLYTKRSTDTQANAPTLSGTAVPATNAFNPFGVAVSANYLFDGIGPRHLKTDAQLSRGVAGLRGGLGTWDWEVSMMASQEQATAWTERATDATRVAQALASSDPTLALNVFQDGPGGSAALLTSLIATPKESAFKTTGTQAAAFLRGALFEWPAGEAQLAIGGEWRSDGARYRDFLSFTDTRHASAAFAELNVPLVNAAMQWPAVHGLSLKLAGRYDNYSDFGGTFNPQYGVVWTPVEGLLLRASYGTSFRPPSLFELYAPPTVVPLSIADPRHGNQVVSATAIAGGNPSLQPVEGDSFTAGFVLTPQRLKQLRIAASYWRVSLDERVSLFSPSLLLANEAQFPSRVERGDPSPADVAAGRPGPLLQMDISRVNFGRLETGGIDASASYALHTAVGEWNLSAAATWIERYETADVPNARPKDRVGIASALGTIPQWRGTASLGWQRQGFSLSATGRFVPSYRDDAGGNPALSGARVDAQSLLDLQAAWDADLAVTQTFWLSGFKLALGVSNVFDEEPPFALMGGSSNGYDLSQGDLRQRFAYVNVSKRF